MSTDICLYSALLCWYRNTTMPSKQITLHNKEIKKYQASRIITALQAAHRLRTATENYLRNGEK
jgi:hypothetical protein